MSTIVSVLLITIYLFAAAALFVGMLQDYPHDSFGEKMGSLFCCLIWPVCLVIAGVIIIQAAIEQWRDRHG